MDELTDRLEAAARNAMAACAAVPCRADRPRRRADDRDEEAEGVAEERLQKVLAPRASPPAAPARS
jgi:hypothetical protein